MARRRRRRRSGRRPRSISLPTALNSVVVSGAQRRNARCSPGLSAASGSPRSGPWSEGSCICCTSEAIGRIRPTLAPFFRRSTSTRRNGSLGSRSSLGPDPARYPMAVMPRIPRQSPAPARPGVGCARIRPRRTRDRSLCDLGREPARCTAEPQPGRGGRAGCRRLMSVGRRRWRRTRRSPPRREVLVGDDRPPRRSRIPHRSRI